MNAISIDTGSTALVVIDLQKEHEYPMTKIFPRLGRIRKTEEIVAGLEAKR